jgi:hypothetical protein
LGLTKNEDKKNVGTRNIFLYCRQFSFKRSVSENEWSEELDKIFARERKILYLISNNSRHFYQNGTKTDLPHDESGIPVVELPGRDPERSIDPPHVLVGLDDAGDHPFPDSDFKLL